MSLRPTKIDEVFIVTAACWRRDVEGDEVEMYLFVFAGLGVDGSLVEDWTVRLFVEVFSVDSFC